MLEATSITGPAKAALTFARENAGHGSPVDLTMLTFARGEAENGFTRAARAEGIRLETVQEAGALDRSVLGRLRDAVTQARPDVIWTNAVKSHFLTRAAGLNRRAKWVAFHHGYTTTAWRTRAYNQLDRWSLRAPERIVTVCGAFAKDLERRGADGTRIRVQHMPIARSARRSDGEALRVRTETRRELGIDAEAFTLLAVGRLSREKGFADLLRAYAIWREKRPREAARLAIAGDGPESAKLRALAQELGISGEVIFAGHRADVGPMYGMADGLVMPSHSEGSPNVLLEALDAGLAVAATDVGGIPEMVTNEESALLVRSHDPEALAEAMARLISDEALRARLRAAAPGVLARHTPERFFENLLGIFREAA